MFLRRAFYSNIENYIKMVIAIRSISLRKTSSIFYYPFSLTELGSSKMLFPFIGPMQVFFTRNIKPKILLSKFGQLLGHWSSFSGSAVDCCYFRRPYLEIRHKQCNACSMFFVFVSFRSNSVEKKNMKIHCDHSINLFLLFRLC